MAATWCIVCCTQHDAGPLCPGSLLATGPERHGWRIEVLTPRGPEVYGILIAQAGDLWRARVLTYPNMLWSAPGGRGTLKFAGASASEVESKARDFIHAHRKARGFRLGEEGAKVQSAPLAAEAKSDAKAKPDAEAGGTDRRCLRTLQILFGERKAIEPAATGDLSRSGLFVITDRPLPEGRQLRLTLQLEHCSLPLTGTVQWVRVKREKGRPAGMGVLLRSPPALYLSYVESLS